MLILKRRTQIQRFLHHDLLRCRAPDHVHVLSVMEKVKLNPCDLRLFSIYHLQFEKSSIASPCANEVFESSDYGEWHELMLSLKQG